jgi:hypothetical protein
VLGYTAADGGFCFEFRKLTGGCLQRGVLTDAQPHLRSSRPASAIVSGVRSRA